MAGRPLDTTSSNVNNASVNYSGRQNSRGTKVNPKLSASRGNRDVASGKATNNSPSGFASEVGCAPVGSVKNGGANGTGSF